MLPTIPQSTANTRQNVNHLDRVIEDVKRHCHETFVWFGLCKRLTDRVRAAQYVARLWDRTRSVLQQRFACCVLTEAANMFHCQTWPIGQ